MEPLYVDDFDEADLECSKKRKRYWTASQEAIRYHRLKEKFLKERIRQQDKRIDELESLIEKLQRNKKVESDVLFFLEVVE